MTFSPSIIIMANMETRFVHWEISCGHLIAHSHIQRGGAIKMRLHVASLERFHEFILALTTCVEDQLKSHCYNTVGNFLTFFESYKNRKDLTQSLESFYGEYNPPITAKHHTCVGLGLDLAGRIVELKQTYPGISSALFLASCEEDIGNVNRYVSTPTPDTRTSEKEHVVIALNIELEGRVGVLILDTGYHVPRPVIVMEDRLYPHTGWFKPGGTSRSRRLYNYTLHPSGRYVLWDVKETRKGIEDCESARIYTHQAFLSPVDCTERRNLVYNCDVGGVYYQWKFYTRFNGKFYFWVHKWIP
ncbi:uncharacterized protein LOC130695543 [Daphnia carinata]|uniref:uncharacterized protein LOC130695543 n=1 Tax=Daphnia carinata TaxID=120202 RepID=UPI002579D916|nr:uncharacterized protein LOC130695543 [Daphnia carinata]